MISQSVVVFYVWLLGSIFKKYMFDIFCQSVSSEALTTSECV